MQLRPPTDTEAIIANARSIGPIIEEEADKFAKERRLTDDVVAQTCAFGDCLLQELSYIEGGWPRATTNDKPLLDDWPYLAEPWPEKAEAAPATNSILPYIIGFVFLFAFVSWAIIELARRLIIWLWFKARTQPQPA